MTTPTTPSADINAVLDIVLESSGAQYKNSLRQHSILQASWLAMQQENAGLREQIIALQQQVSKLSTPTSETNVGVGQYPLPTSEVVEE